jgi:hypothetical protein
MDAPHMPTRDEYASADIDVRRELAERFVVSAFDQLVTVPPDGFYDRVRRLVATLTRNGFDPEFLDEDGEAMAAYGIRLGPQSHIVLQAHGDALLTSLCCTFSHHGIKLCLAISSEDRLPRELALD